jgi:uncharacterized protein YndB with AHSA1/START domain
MSRCAIASSRACRFLVTGVTLLGLFACAHAEVKYAQSDSALMEFHETINASPARVFAALGQIGHWWNGEHSWSGDANNLSLSLSAGGCFCERWDKGSVQHGVVIMVRSDELLRLDAPLGPLQGRALKAILTYQLKAAGGATELHTTFLINGTDHSKIDATAQSVNDVVGESLVRLKNYIETGTP